VTLEGAASLGPVVGGVVTAYEFVDGARGATVGLPSVTDNAGRFALDVGGHDGPLLIELTGSETATYLDLVTGEPRSLSVRVAYRTLIESASSGPVAITPFTELATYGALINGGTAEAIDLATTAVHQSLLDPGVDIFHTLPADLSGDTGSADAESYVAAIAGLSAVSTTDDGLPDVHAVTARYEHDIFPDPGVVFAAVTDFAGGISIGSLVASDSWGSFDNGLRQPVTISPAGSTDVASVTVVDVKSVPVDPSDYLGPTAGWSGAVSTVGWQTDSVGYFTTVDKQCSVGDIQHLVWAYETALANLMNTFDLDESDLGIGPDNRLSVMCTNQSGAGSGSPEGFRVVGYQRATSGRSPAEYYELVKHETVHTIQGILVRPALPKIHWWFSEGLAVWLAGPADPVPSYEALLAWPTRVTPPQPPIQNPISVIGPGSSPASDINPSTHMPWMVTEGYYPAFAGAVEYLMTPRPLGAGNTLADVKDLFAAVGRGTDFEQAFDSTMNITEAEFEVRFDEIMSQFLR